MWFFVLLLLAVVALPMLSYWAASCRIYWQIILIYVLYQDVPEVQTVWVNNGHLYGKSAGYKRNVAMAEAANACVVFWDGKSRGSQHMINICEERDIPVRVIKY